MQLDFNKTPDHLANVQAVAALELAIGSSLPSTSFDDWPPSLAWQWVDAAERDAFEHCATLGEAAVAFLQWRISEIDRIRQHRAARAEAAA